MQKQTKLLILFVFQIVYLSLQFKQHKQYVYKHTSGKGLGRSNHT